MRKSDAAAVAANRTADTVRREASVQVVCLALSLAIAVLAFRIFSLL